jgi:hypothetical protein
MRLSMVQDLPQRQHTLAWGALWNSNQISPQHTPMRIHIRQPPRAVTSNPGKTPN